MSNWKNRTDIPIVSTSRSSPKSRNLAKSKSHKTTTVNSIQLPGIEEMDQSESAASVPFVFVDGMCTKTRQQLHVALSKCEKRRMKWIQRQCCVLPLLKYMKPATRAEPTTPEEKEAQEEKDFQEDLKQLCIAELKVGDSIDHTGSETPIAHATSCEDIMQYRPRLDEIRLQLEELRQKQEESLFSDRDYFPSKPPKLMRQGTFDVKQDERLTKNSSNSSLGSFKGKCMAKNPGLMRSVTMSQSLINNVHQKNTANCLFKNKSYTLLPDAKKTNHVPAQNPSDFPNIINQIEDLLLQLPLQQEEDGEKLENGSHYLVTHTPSKEKMAGKALPTVIASTSSSRPTTSYDPPFFCGNKANILSENEPPSSVEVSTLPKTPVKLVSRTSSFLKMSTKLLKKLKN